MRWLTVLSELVVHRRKYAPLIESARNVRHKNRLAFEHFPQIESVCCSETMNLIESRRRQHDETTGQINPFRPQYIASNYFRLTNPSLNFKMLETIYNSIFSYFLCVISHQNENSGKMQK